MENQNAINILAKYGTKTDVTHRLSYDSGIQNIVGVPFTSTQIRLRYENNTSDDMLYYFAPINLIGLPTINNVRELAQNPVALPFIQPFFDILDDVNLPKGVPFYLSVSYGMGDAIAKSKDEDRKLHILAASMNETFIQVKGMHFRSFDKGGKPENSNYGNSITPYNINAYRDKKRRQPINLSAFQSSRDYSTEILKIDLIKNNIVLPVSQEDVFTFKVNANTKLDITLDVGARESRTERFYRDLQEGTKMLLETFPSIENKECK